MQRNLWSSQEEDKDGFYTFMLDSVYEPFEFKITLGSWEEEGRMEGRHSNANFRANGIHDTVIRLSFDFWGDLPSSVVGELDIYQLPDTLSANGFRTIRVFPSRAALRESDRTYSVLYMADGQNLFDSKTANYGEWRIDEYMSGLELNEMDAIVVGIDNSPNRSSEYLDTELGKAYRSFVTQTVIPFIDSLYPTIPDRYHRVAGGASAGGTVSYLHAIYDADYFGGAMCFSPALHLQEEEYNIHLMPLLEDADPFVFYMDMGGKGVDVILHPGCQLIDERLSNDNRWSSYYLGYKYFPEDDHNEEAWANRFPLGYMEMKRALDRLNQEE